MALVLASAVMALLAGLGVRWHWWPFYAGFAILRWSVYGALAGMVVSVVGLLRSLRVGRRRSLPLAVLALLLGVAVAAVPARMALQARSSARINDITTDTERPPPFVALLPLRGSAPVPSAYPGEDAAALQRRAYPDIQPARFTDPPERVMAVVEAVAHDLDWNVVASVPAEGRLEATATTYWFGFTDDIVVRVQSQDGVTRVDIRSTSRVGRSDLGTNARRIRRFLAGLKARGLSPAP
jgi:uncharacterized protein (DUF1499 family)